MHVVFDDLNLLIQIKNFQEKNNYQIFIFSEFRQSCAELPKLCSMIVRYNDRYNTVYYSINIHLKSFHCVSLQKQCNFIKKNVYVLKYPLMYHKGIIT